LGIDLRGWRTREPVARAPGEIPRLIHVATLNGVKNQRMLLAALSHLDGRDYRLDVVGDDTLGGAVQRRAVELGLAGRITFHGFKTQRELRALVERAHIHVLSSLHEAGPFVLLECAAAGVPTAGTAVGHLVEWPPSAVAAVPVGDATALARAIGRLIDDEPLRLRMAAAALAQVRRENLDHTVECFERLYGEIA
jgi:glycosyltransferase involved in cell wall biosynthesis